MWVPVPDLLSSTEFSRHFVADVDDVGRAVLRFGDGQYGERFANVDSVDVWYRVGNGRSGNIGADSLGYLSLGSLRKAVQDDHQDYCYACYTGNYPTELVNIQELMSAKDRRG